MNNISYQVERAEKELEKSLERGDITDAEFQMEMNALHREAWAAIEEEAQQAYDDVMGRY